MSFRDSDIKYKHYDITYSVKGQSTPKKIQVRIDDTLSLSLLTHGSSDGLTHCTIIGGDFDRNISTVFLSNNSATHAITHSV